MLQRLQEYGFTLKRKKCAFLQEKVEYFGQIVSADGFTPSMKKVSAIQNMPQPKNISQLRSLLGTVQHHSKFLPNFADKCAPLNKLLKNDTAWQWSSECVDAFENIKQLTATEALVHYNPDLLIYIAADASSEGMGAVIYHKINCKERPIAHASKTLN